MLKLLNEDHFKNNSISVFYKPVVEINTGEVKGLEALNKISIEGRDIPYHGIETMLSYKSFYTKLSEESFSFTMDMHMANESLKSYADIYKDFPKNKETPRLHLNFSSRSLNDGNMMVEMLQHTLDILNGSRATDIRAGNIVIELDNRHITKNHADHLDAINAIKGQGFAVVYENFHDSVLPKALNHHKKSRKIDYDAMDPLLDNLKNFQDCMRLDAIKLNINSIFGQTMKENHRMSDFYNAVEDMGILFIADGISSDDDRNRLSRYKNIPLGQGSHEAFGMAMADTLVKRWFKNTADLDAPYRNGGWNVAVP